MNNYKLTVMVGEDTDEKTRTGLLDDVKKSFGKLGKEDLWGMRDLAYPILHKNKAYYAHYEFESEPDTISKLDNSLKLNEDVIRYLLVRYNPAKKMKKITKKVVEEAKAAEVKAE